MSTSTSIGHLGTPFGIVLVYAERYAYTGEFGLRCRGTTAALRWLLPRMDIADGADRTFLLPPEGARDRAQIPEHFRALQASAKARLDQITAPSSSRVTLGDFLKLVETEVASSVRAGTLQTYRHEWKGVTAYFSSETPVVDISRERIQAMIGAKLGEGLSRETVKKHLIQLRRILNRAVEDGLLTNNPAKQVRLPKAVRRKPRFFDAGERERLFRAAKSRGRDAYLLIACGIFLGLRKGELLALRWEHVDLDRRLAHVRNTTEFTTKSGKERSVPICQELADILLPYHQPAALVLCPNHPYLAGRRYRWDLRFTFDACCRDAGIDLSDVSPHVMRHSFASIAAQQGVSLYKIASWMGHSAIEVTELYAHLCAFDGDIERLNSSAQPPTHRPNLRIVK